MKKNNVWFLINAILLILASVSFFIASIAMSSTLSLVKNGVYPITDSNGNALTGEELAAAQKVFATILTAWIVVILICLAVSVFEAVVYFKYCNKSKEEIKKSSGLIIATIVLSFLFSGVLVGVFGILGYLADNRTQSNIENTDVTIENAEPSKQETSSSYEQVKKDLEALENLKNSGIISEEEYKQKRQDIINKM